MARARSGSSSSSSSSAYLIHVLQFEGSNCANVYQIQHNQQGQAGNLKVLVVESAAAVKLAGLQLKVDIRLEQLALRAFAKRSSLIL